MGWTSVVSDDAVSIWFEDLGEDIMAIRASSGNFSGFVMMDVLVLKLCTAFKNNGRSATNEQFLSSHCIRDCW